MRLYFKPFLGLTIFTLIGLAILLSLGTWQYHRLQWKTQLLEDVETAVNAAPFTSISQIGSALDNEAPIDFRRVEATLYTQVGDRVFYVFTPTKQKLLWRPFTLIGSNSGTRLFAAFAPISDTEKSEGLVRQNSKTQIAGYVRLARKKTRGQVKSTPETNRWFGFNPLANTENDWGELSGGGVETRYYIDIEPGVTQASELEIKRPNIRNNHFDYMLTWYGLALVLLIFYILLHRRAGRLGLGGAS